MNEINKANIRLVVLKWVEAYFFDREIKLSLLEIIKITEAISDYVEKGIPEDLEEKFKIIDRWLRNRIKNPSTGSLTLKKE